MLYIATAPGWTPTAGVVLATVNVLAAVAPVPVNVALWGEPVALSVTEIAAVSAPIAVGLKFTVIVQLPPAATLVPQLLLWAKLLIFAPVTEMLVMVSAPVPGFESVNGNAVAYAPTTVLGKASGLGLSVACGTSTAVPVPVSVAL
jgi:hypothetical protein